MPTSISNQRPLSRIDNYIDCLEEKTNTSNISTQKSLKTQSASKKKKSIIDSYQGSQKEAKKSPFENGVIVDELPQKSRDRKQSRRSSIGQQAYIPTTLKQLRETIKTELIR